MSIEQEPSSYRTQEASGEASKELGKQQTNNRARSEWRIQQEVSKKLSKKQARSERKIELETSKDLSKSI